jgi:hypothetical protein
MNIKEKQDFDELVKVAMSSITSAVYTNVNSLAGFTQMASEKNKSAHQEIAARACDLAKALIEEKRKIIPNE